MKTIPATSHEAVLSSKKLVAENTYEIGFTFEADFYFLPGQYIWLKVPKLLFDDQHGNQRAFSILLSPQDKRTIYICFRDSQSGFKKTLLGLPIGANVTINGPFGGNFCLADQINRYVFAAGGTGISSFLSVLRDGHTWENDKHITFFLANRSKESAPYLEELEALSRTQKKFELHEVFGDITAESVSFVQSAPDALYYISGPAGFVDALYEALSTRDVSGSLMHFEENYPRKLQPKKSTHMELFSASPLSPMARLLLEETTNHITFTDIDGRILFANTAAQRSTGYTLDEMRENTPRLWGGLMGHDFYEQLWKTIKTERKPFVDKITNRKKSGILYTVLARISPISDDDGNLVGFVGTEEDITETERVSQAKTDFVSTASHQLRTPLSIMRWYSELLLGGEGGKPSKKQSEYLNEILQGARRMADLIDALLTVSRIELGTFSVELKDTDVSALAASVKGDFVPIIAAKKLILTERYAEGLPHMRTDSRLLHAIYYNLLSNAVKYSHEGGTITIDIHAVEAGDEVSGKIVPEKSLVCSVSDTGYGIPEFQKMLIFTKFFRADNARINVPDGTGLGLYIVKSLVEYMKGMIWFESTENKGTTFYVVLPLAGTLAKEGATRLS